MRIHCLQHVPFETPGEILAWARTHGHETAGTRVYAGEPLPGIGAYDWLVVLGGPMNVHDHDRHPWLAEEKRTVAAAIEAGKTVLGICLGAQLVAAVLGGSVTRNAVAEIGWFDVSLTPDGGRHPLTRRWPPRFNAFHWHGDTFEVPDGAVHLASSEACARQMFAYGRRVVGVQYHLEMTARGVADLARHCRDELVPGPFVQTDGALLADNSRLHAAHAVLHSLLDRLEEESR